MRKSVRKFFKLVKGLYSVFFLSVWESAHAHKKTTIKRNWNFFIKVKKMPPSDGGTTHTQNNNNSNEKPEFLY